VDGGLVEYLPVETVLEYRPDLVVGVNLGYRETRSTLPRHLLHVAMAVTGVAAQHNARLSETKADIVIRPSTARFPSFDLMASSELIGVGYSAAKDRIPDVLAALDRVQAGPGWMERLKFWNRA
jgi:predicted acylesterase/phospholipase RssA